MSEQTKSEVDVVNPTRLTSIDEEISAQRGIAAVLIPLDKEARQRVMQWTLSYFWPDRWGGGGGLR